MGSWESELADIHYENNGTFKRGELTNIFTNLGDRYDTEVSKIKNYYYRVVKKNSSTKNSNSEKTITKKETTKDTTSEKHNINFTEGIKYPADNLWIFSYENEHNEEWIVLEDVLEFLTNGKRYYDFLEAHTTSDYILSYKRDEKNVHLINKVNLLKTLDSFCNLTTSPLTKKETRELITLLKESNITLNKRILDKVFFDIKYNDILKVYVSKVVSFGAMVQVVGHEDITGIIHISEVKKGYVTDINDYFKEGDILNARVTSKKEDYKLSFSIIGVENKHVNTIENKPDKQTNISIVEQESPNTLGASPLNLQSKNAIGDAKVKTENRGNNDTIDKQNQLTPNDLKLNIPKTELDNIEIFIKSIVGPLSVEAKNKIITLINEYGFFNFSININESSKEFQSDLGLLLLDKVEQKLRDGL